MYSTMVVYLKTLEHHDGDSELAANELNKILQISCVHTGI